MFELVFVRGLVLRAKVSERWRYVFTIRTPRGLGWGDDTLFSYYLLSGRSSQGVSLEHGDINHTRFSNTQPQ